MRVRTSYSFKTAVGSLAETYSRLQDIGWSRFPLTDRNSTFGFVKWKKMVSDPVYGVELAVTRDIGPKPKGRDWWTFLAQDDMKPLHELVLLATSNPGGCLNYKQALETPGVIRVAGSSVELDLIPDTQPIFLSPSIPRGMLKAILEKGNPLVASSDNMFPREGDRELYRVALGNNLASVQTYPQWLLSDDEFRSALKWAGSENVETALAKRDQLLAASRATLPTAITLVPDKPLTLREMCEQGAARKGVDLSDPIYLARLDRELALIEEKAFTDYFCIISDMVQWAKERMVVGPARGSSCGSLVCYLVDITAIDPIPHGLIFERFIDVTRKDLPDIDLDFSDHRREMVFRYAEEKYGKDHVARLGTVTQFKAKSILNQIGVSLRIPTWKVDELTKTVIHRSAGDSRASSTINDTFETTEIGREIKKDYPEALIAGRMEGLPRNSGQHAAGIVITESPITEVVAIDGQTGATMCDKKDAEELNLLKIDALGLTQLGIFERCLELMGVKELSRYLERIPLGDQAAFDVLNNLKFSGIFQFVPGSAASGLTTEMVTVQGGRIDKFEDIVELTALIRPGPLGSGATREWIMRRCGHREITYFHDCLIPYVKDTLGVVVYQEQVLQIGREIGGLSWEDVTELRKAMSRSLGKEFFDRYGEKWKVGAAEKGMNKEERDQFWNDLCLFGMWAFNKSHSVSYAMVTYWCLWLKAHYPLEFAAASLDASTDDMSQSSARSKITALRELKSEGIDYVPVDPKHSTDRWNISPDRKTLIGPLTGIKGFGPKKVELILDSRKSGRPLTPALAKSLANPVTEIDSLSPISDRVNELYPDLKEIGIQTPVTPVLDITNESGTIVIIGVIRRLAPLNENEPARVARRGGRLLDGPTESLNFWVRDDSGDEIFCKIDRFKFPKIGRSVVEKCRQARSIYAVKGFVPPDFRMLRTYQIKYLGEVDGA